MAGTKVATRYAKSYLGLASENGLLEDAYKDMSFVLKTTMENRDLVNMLKSPVVNTDKKVSILEMIYGEQLSKASMLFLTLITKKRREGTLPEIADAFIKQYKTLKGITTAKVTSAAALSDSAKKKVLELVQNEVGGTVELETEVDAELIGGFVLRIGDKQLDTSILNKIAELRQGFTDSRFVKSI